MVYTPVQVLTWDIFDNAVADYRLLMSGLNLTMLVYITSRYVQSLADLYWRLFRCSDWVSWHTCWARQYSPVSPIFSLSVGT